MRGGGGGQVLIGNPGIYTVDDLIQRETSHQQMFRHLLGLIVFSRGIVRFRTVLSQEMCRESIEHMVDLLWRSDTSCESFKCTDR